MNELQRTPGSVFVNVPEPRVHPPTDADSRLMVASEDYEKTWNGVADHFKSLIPSPATSSSTPTANHRKLESCEAPTRNHMAQGCNPCALQLPQTSQRVTPPEKASKARRDAPKMTAEGHHNDRFLNKIQANLKVIARWVTPDEVFVRFHNKYNQANLEDIKAGLSILVESGRAKVENDGEKDLYMSADSKPQPLGKASDVRVRRHNHFDGSVKLIYEGPRTDDIYQRCEDYARKSGFKVVLVCDDPHEINSFQPPVLREDPDAPPTSDPDVVREERLEKLGCTVLSDHSAMFLDDRMRKTRRNRTMNRKKILAYLNWSEREQRFWLNIRRKDAFGIECPIPAAVKDLSGAVEWVLRKAFWREVS